MTTPSACAPLPHFSKEMSTGLYFGPPKARRASKPVQMLTSWPSASSRYLRTAGRGKGTLSCIPLTNKV